MFHVKQNENALIPYMYYNNSIFVLDVWGMIRYDLC